MKVVASPIAFNEELKIGKVLERFPPGVVDDIVVIDDASTDGTPGVIARFGVNTFRQGPSERNPPVGQTDCGGRF
jgi:glycosyltransferase involved in cell wall biosynthesis